MSQHDRDLHEERDPDRSRLDDDVDARDLDHDGTGEHGAEALGGAVAGSVIGAAVAGSPGALVGSAVDAGGGAGAGDTLEEGANHEDGEVDAVDAVADRDGRDLVR